VFDTEVVGRSSISTEWTRAEQAVHLITQRGFARSRDLQGALDELRISAI
jgi:hypothetical protein